MTEQPWSNLFRGSTFRSVVVVAMGTLGAQVVLLAATPALTRVYGPEAFGALGSVLALTGIVGPVAGLCLPLAIVLAKDRGEAGSLAWWGVGLAVLPSVILALIAPMVLGQVVQAGVARGVLALSVAMLIYGSVLNQVLQQSLLRLQSFRLISRLAISQAVVLVALQIGTGLMAPTPTVLVAVSGLNFLLFIVVALVVVPPLRGRASAVLRSARDPWAVFKRYSDFSLYRAPQVLINSLGTHLPVLVLAWYADLLWVAFLAVTQRMLSLPVLLLGRSITDVLYPKFEVHARAGGRLFPALVRWTVFSLAVGIFISLVVMASAHWLYEVVLGEEWRDGGVLAHALIPWLLGALVCRPAVAALPVLGLQRHYLFSELLSTAAKSGVLLWALSTGWGVVASMLVWSVISGLGAAYISGVAILQSRTSRSLP